MTSPSRVRVLMLSDELGWGGAERFMVGLATNLPQDRYEVTVCTTRGQWRGPLIGEMEEVGVRYVNLGRRGRYDLRPFPRLVRMLRDVDVVHAHKFGSNVWGTLFGRLARVPVVVAHEQTWSYEGNPVRRTLDGQFIGRFADAFVAVSTADRDRMISVEGVPADKPIVIPNAYIPRRTADDEGDLRSELGIGPDVPLVGTAAVLRPQKNLEVLLDAFAAVLREVPEAQLVVAGEGPRREPLEEHAARLGIAERTCFLGLRNDVNVVLRGLDVAAMSSDYEGLPLFACECLANGTPLVSTDVGGLSDLVEDGRSGLLVPPRDSGAMAAAIVSLLRDPERRRAIGDAGRERLQEFTIDRIVPRFTELYDRLLGERRRRG